ncbi:hypothetical protein KDL45_12455 [bacterium]|nr:hypothetical protein [bacterium]
MSPIRQIVHTAGAVALLLLITLLVALAAPRVFRAEHTNALPGAQADGGFAPALPPGWEVPDKKGRIAALATARGHLFVAGPGLGIYRNADGKSWEPFSLGLPAALDTTAVDVGPAGLFIGDRGGRLLSWQGEKWQSVGETQRGPIRELIVLPDRLLIRTDAGWMDVGLNPRTAANIALPPNFENGAASIQGAYSLRPDAPTPTARVWLDANGGAVLTIDETPSPETWPVLPEKPGDPAILVPAAPGVGLYFQGASALPDEYATHPIRDVAFQRRDGDGALELLLAVDNLGMLVVPVTEQGVGQVRAVHDGLPLAAVTGLVQAGGTVFAGTDGRGVFRLAHEGVRFEPFNAGLLYPAQ